MHLNTIQSAPGARKSKTRVGRGIGSGKGKTCGRGHKGQKSRAGGTVRWGFEGGQMPLQRRTPKSGFSSRKQFVTQEVRLQELAKVADGVITIDSLRQANVIGSTIKRVKIFASGKLEKAVTISAGIPVSKGAREAIEAAGGKIEG